MSLYQCHYCGARENTALAEWFWLGTDKKCSECQTGKWHGEFPKLVLPLGEFKTNQRGNLEHVSGLSLAEWLDKTKGE